MKLSLRVVLYESSRETSRVRSYAFLTSNSSGTISKSVDRMIPVAHVYWSIGNIASAFHSDTPLFSGYLKCKP